MSYQFKFPDVGEGLHEAEIIRWLAQPGQEVKRDEPIVEVQTDKSVVEIPSPVTGIIATVAGEEGSTIRVGDILVTIDEQGESVKEIQKQCDDKINQEGLQNVNSINESGYYTPVKAAKRVKAAPSVRKLARELGVNLEEIVGTGPSGRIIEADVKRFSQSINLQSNPKTERNDQQAAPNKSVEVQREEEVPFLGLRRKISEKMVKSVYTIPHATGMGEVDVTKLVEFRKNLIPYAEKHGCKLTYLPFIIKAVTKSLIENPYLNATLDEERGKIILKKYYNIGVATATKEGLIVPVIKDADQKSILEIALELQSLSEKARQRKIELKDLQDSTFTISSTGNTGGGGFATPIINYPEVAILGIYAIKEKPAVVNGEIAIRSMMGTALSFDHRVMDGLESGAFMNSVTTKLENPETMLLEAR